MTNYICAQRMLALASALLLAACNALPIYQPEPREPVTTIKLIGMGSMSLCKGGHHYQLKSEVIDGFTTIRVGTKERISLTTFMQFQGYNVISSCHPSLSLIPEPGIGLVANSGLSNGSCFMEIVREDASRPSGVALEPTLKAPQC